MPKYNQCDKCGRKLTPCIVKGRCGNCSTKPSSRHQENGTQNILQAGLTKEDKTQAGYKRTVRESVGVEGA